MSPMLSDAKTKEGIFVRPHINTMLSLRFKEKMNKTEKEAWQALRGVVDRFLGNKREEIS